MAAASTESSPPPKAHAFDVVVPVGTSADDLIDGISAIVGLPEVFSAQHLGGTNFQVVVNTLAAALKLREAGSVSIANQLVPIVPTGPQVTNVTCLFLPTFVRNDQLVQALAPYGKVIDVSYATYQRTATVKTGTRFIRMEMKGANPLPNFLRVAGHRATFDYRGLKRVCRRCRQEGHVRAQCTTGYCDRCGVFGHPTEGCTANCARCGGTHATVDCTAKRSYSSMVTGNYATDFPALDPGNATCAIAPEAAAVPTVSTVAPPSPPDAAGAAAPPPLPSPPPPAPPEPSPTGSGVTSAEATDSARTAAVVVGDTAYAAWSQASGDGEVSSDSDHLVIDENPAPGGPAETPTDSMDTTTTDTPESDSSRLPHEDSKHPLRSSGSRSLTVGAHEPRAPRNRESPPPRVGTPLQHRPTAPRFKQHAGVPIPLFYFILATLRILSLNVRGFRNPAKQTEVMHFARMQNCDLLCLQDTNFARFRGWSFPCIELAAPILALKTTLAILDDHDNPARPLTLYFLGANNRLLGDSLLSPLRPRAETTPAFYRSTADLFDKLSVHVSREEILEAPASRPVERLVVADQAPPPPGAVQPYPWLALTSSTLPDHVCDFEWLKGNLVLNSVFLHGDLAARPYRAPDFRDALSGVIDRKDIVAMGQYQMSHVWMVVCATSLAKSKLVSYGELKVKGKKCLVVDPESKEVKLRLLWLPPHMENRRVVEALEPFGTVRSIVREKWKCEGMEGMDTLNREVQLTLRDDISVSKIPHLLTIYGCQSLLLIPGRPPLCLRCNRVGHIRRQCRTPRCTKCQRYGHSLADCVLTYADRLKIGTVDESATEYLMDASEVVEPSGDIPMMTEPPDPTLQPLPPEQPEGSLPSPDACTEHPASPPTNPKSTLNISQTPEHKETLTDDQRKTTTTEVEDEVVIWQLRLARLESTLSEEHQVLYCICVFLASPSDGRSHFRIEPIHISQFRRGPRLEEKTAC
ncbi:mucin-7-like [Ixodes scapularis]